MQGKVIIFCAPSGSGKTTVVHHLLETFDCFGFSVSAASRKPRQNEVDGVDYFFISNEEFNRRVAAGDFVEHEQVYPGCQYGTLKSEVNRLWNEGKVILFDVDVKGGINLKHYFGESALSVFVKAPSIEDLRRRLEGRGTDSQEAIEKRLAKADEEMQYEHEFDYVLINNDMQKCFAEADRVIGDFIEK